MGLYEKRLKPILRALMPQSVRPHRILAGPLRGRVIVTSWHDYPGAILGRTERELLGWFRRTVGAGETWVDVGAHYGYTAIALSELVGVRGRVFAFEPVLATAGYLARTRSINHLAQLIVLPCGLGASDDFELRRLPVVRGMADSTLDIADPLREPFLVAGFDALWRGICEDRPRVDGVKIDVQGMELEVLRGMVTTLREFTPKLVVELHRGVDRSELLALLVSLGYSPNGEPVETEGVDRASRYADDRSYVFCPRDGALTGTT
jgi:FkbM family methyltransferase